MISQDSYVIYVCDTETTGLDPEKCDVIEISMSRLLPQNDGSYQEEQKTWFLRAMNPQAIQDKALAVNGFDRNEILGITAAGRAKHRLPPEVIQEIENWIMDDNVSSMDRIFAGQNPNFDIDMLRTLWRKNGKGNNEDFPFAVDNGNRIVDTKMIVTLFDICTGKRRKAYGLGQLVKACSVKKDKAHSAAGDVAMTRDLLLKLVNIIKTIVAEQFKDCYPDSNGA